MPNACSNPVFTAKNSRFRGSKLEFAWLQTSVWKYQNVDLLPVRMASKCGAPTRYESVGGDNGAFRVPKEYEAEGVVKKHVYVLV